MMSASSGVFTRSAPWVWRRTSIILSESYSFIWQPNVRTKTLRGLPAGAGATGVTVGWDSARTEGARGSAGADAPAEGRLTEISCMVWAVTGVYPGGIRIQGSRYCSAPARNAQAISAAGSSFLGALTRSSRLTPSHMAMEAATNTEERRVGRERGARW